MSVAALAVFSAAQSEFNPKPPEVTATPVGRVFVAPGTAANVPLKFRLSHGYHINSNIPRSELLIPTVLTLEPSSPQVRIRLTYPKGEDVAFDFEPGRKLSVYEGEFVITARIRAARTAKPGVHTVRGTLKYQACNDRACFPPKSMPVEFDVEVAKPASTAASSSQKP
ncbi:MAG: protein-disulfide reductase DsbD N-terminal domain-containing protein [Acidobacteria bacterium]|nr:protein-disulfide reductase DsbD N-terminal domain-containing protein [Acidobacteriota bacterium]